MKTHVEIEIVSATVEPRVEGNMLEVKYLADGEQRRLFEPAWSDDHSTSRGINDDFSPNYDEILILIREDLARRAH